MTNLVLKYDDTSLETIGLSLKRLLEPQTIVPRFGNGERYIYSNNGSVAVSEMYLVKMLSSLHSEQKGITRCTAIDAAQLWR